METTVSLGLIPDKKVPENNGIAWEFTDKPVTAWGGLRLIREMLIRMNFREVRISIQGCH